MSPQRGPQTEGWPVQVYPDSKAQVGEQPSPVMLLPSSHCSAPKIRESPQMAVQFPPVVLEEGQTKPVYIKQEEEQPSPLTVLPSSQL